LACGILLGSDLRWGRTGRLIESGRTLSSLDFFSSRSKSSPLEPGITNFGKGTGLTSVKWLRCRLQQAWSLPQLVDFNPNFRR
jgi:hypothetical protein